MAKNTKNTEKKENTRKVKNLHLKFVPTGNVFELPEIDALEILKTDRGNYQIVDKDFVEAQEEEITETSTYEQVVAE